MKKVILLSALLVSALTNAADFANLSFKANSGQNYESPIVLPKPAQGDGYQIVYQSINTFTSLAKASDRNKKNDSDQDLITQWVTHGVSIKAKVIDQEEGLYKFHIEYTGKPKIEMSEKRNDFKIIDSPDDMVYEVRLALKSSSPVCSEISTGSENNAYSGSKLCISFP